MSRWLRLYASPARVEELPPGRLNLDQMQAAVGGYIEQCPLPAGWGRFELWVNEEGRLDPRKPENSLASYLVDLAYHDLKRPESTIPMLGDCLLRVPS